MSKYRIFKCKKKYCYCENSWIVSIDRLAIASHRTHAEAIAYVQRRAA